MTIDETNMRALGIRDKLKREQDDVRNLIDITLNPIPPFIGSNKIRLLVIGQDPAIRDEAKRKNIRVTLSLDREGSLRQYISQIFPIKHIYATNVFKYFYTVPPSDTLDVLQRHLQPNLELIMEEVNKYPGAPIITLGEPVLKLLATAGSRKVRDYWGYNTKTGKTTGIFAHCLTGNSRLNRSFYPFPHQPSLRKQFYRNTLGSYIDYFRGDTHL